MRRSALPRNTGRCDDGRKRARGARGGKGGTGAAREGRLLSLSTLGQRENPGRASAIGRAASGAVSGAVAAFLAAASLAFVQSERPFARTLVYGLPVWVVELALPIGFAAI